MALEIIKVLLDKGCNPSLPDKSGETPIAIAMKNVRNYVSFLTDTSQFVSEAERREQIDY